MSKCWNNKISRPPCQFLFHRNDRNPAGIGGALIRPHAPQQQTPLRLPPIDNQHKPPKLIDNQTYMAYVDACHIQLLPPGVVVYLSHGQNVYFTLLRLIHIEWV
jgi:hypothetical protein